MEIQVEARLVDGSTQDFRFGESFILEMNRLKAQGINGKALIHSLLTDDWGAPPLYILVTGVDQNGAVINERIPYS